MALARAIRGFGALAVLFASVGACSGGGDTEAVVITPADGYPSELLDRAWPVAMGDAAARGPYEAGRGWVSLVVKRDTRGCVSDLGAEGGTPAARCHAEAAAMYREAAMLYAESIVASWGVMAEETDPREGAHLLAVSYAILGDIEKAKAESAKLATLPAAGDDPTVAWHAPWKAWLDSGAVWPPDLSSLPIELGAPASGTWPSGKPFPHYVLVERSEAKRTIEASDLSELIAQALWHDEAARMAAPDDTILTLAGIQHRFPIELKSGALATASAVTLPTDFLFGTDYLVPEDAQYLADLLGPVGTAAVEAWKDRSLLAALAADSRVEGKIDPEKAIDVAAETRRLTLARLKEQAGGNTEGFHRTFADIARVAVLRGLALTAEAEGDREVSGRLRILALESSNDEWTADASALLAMAAWDAHNEYPVRATEILHNLIRRYPTLEPARFGVDLLALRVSRRRGGLPGQ